jgi:hypothetical protein
LGKEKKMSKHFQICKAAPPHSESPPMGSLDDVRVAVSSVFPNLKWPAEQRCELFGDGGFSIRIGTKQGLVIALIVSGSEDHFASFVDLCKKNGWDLFQNGERADLDHPPG